MADLKEPYILYQYKNAEKMNALLSGIFNQAGEVSVENLYNFLNLDDAVGLWLDQVGLYLNYQRPMIITDHGAVFDDDITVFDGDYTFDSAGVPATDDLYRILLKAYVKKINSNFTLDEVIDNIKTSLGVDKVYIREFNKKAQITCISYTKDISDLVRLLNSLDSRWFGLPTGVSVQSFNFIRLDPTENIFILNHSKLNNNEVLV